MKKKEHENARLFQEVILLGNHKYVRLISMDVAVNIVTGRVVKLKGLDLTSTSPVKPIDIDMVMSDARRLRATESENVCNNFYNS